MDTLIAQYAAQIVKDAYIGILNREPNELESQAFIAEIISTGNSETAIKKLVEALNVDTFKANSNSEASAEDHWKNTVHLYADYVVKSLYLGILNREPEPNSLLVYGSRLREKDFSSIIQGFTASHENSNNWLRKFQSQLTQEKMNNSEELRYRSQNDGIDFRFESNSHLNELHSLSLIFVPSEAWLPFALATASYLYGKYGYSSVFVYLEWAPAIAQAATLEVAVFDIIHFDELKKLSDTTFFKPRVIATHSFGWLKEAGDILLKFPQAKLFVYADGLKNGVDVMLGKKHKIEGAIFFGYAVQHPAIPHEVTLSINAVFDPVAKIANFYKFEPDLAQLKKEEIGAEYAVVYLRYWGSGAYEIELSTVVQSMVDTISRHINTDTRLIIKNDPRALPDLYILVRGALGEKGYDVSSLEDYFLQHGINPAYQKLPVEYFFSKGLLCHAKAHVVFDSSLSYIIATSPNIKRPTRVIVGADISIFRNKILNNLLEKDEKALAAAMDTIQSYSRQYKEAILHSDSTGACELLDSKDDSLFYIQLH
ncbi:hypothetical protein [Aquirhabdus parva]|uniref:DUF4214 domain-containing protein n=1 Tax=Aquirhabdus parva TaxID=2283318 RepID=A0A345P3W6_9GAMM|nr:hypothetical protein [Aquirhabdus parva]AXI01975.1 hypothetical protein HYN46_03290 [Aquirhabdus parva]